MPKYVKQVKIIIFIFFFFKKKKYNNNDPFQFEKQQWSKKIMWGNCICLKNKKKKNSLFFYPNMVKTFKEKNVSM
ncbi:hypothetical protein RclHR1_04500002 [Rhizophagus clarus]|uniref:Uncharacterized protein n=1 Tax=Rhizophagus clarus TaxID=94130 RepID=A0A2Z6RJ25_9GLOM|nr:hypothetical protein RclHR1_04500002 [Rhizophagus clarus]